MNVELVSLASAPLSTLDVDLLLCPVRVPVTDPVTADGSCPVTRWLAAVAKAGDCPAQSGHTVQAYRPDGVQARQLVLLAVSGDSPADMRRALSTALKGLLASRPARLGLYLGSAAPQVVGMAVRVIADASYSYVTTKPSAQPRCLESVQVLVDQPEGVVAEFQLAKAMVVGVEQAREWANRPGNHATPSLLAQAARRLGKPARFSVDVLEPKAIEALGMGAFLAVAQGSAEPPRFIELRYRGARKSSPPVVLIGKGITFDTGGISIKPAAGMDEMKFDMGGAASVLGTFAALAELRPAINVVGLIPTCENMPDGRAIKPGDVVTSMSGQTIEILNTDAEGRLILCDALTYAARLKPRAVIDVATLTGACVIALGKVRTGLFATDDALATHLQTAGDQASDPCWRLPLDDEYAEGLKSPFADVANVGGREGGAITAAKFLQRFVAEWPWAHLDIAGVAWTSGAARGATGRPVPLLVQYLMDEAQRQQASAPVAVPPETEEGR